MRRKSFALILVLTFCVSFLMPGFLLSSQAKADTSGWYPQDAGTTGPLCGVSAVDSGTLWGRAGMTWWGSCRSSGLISLADVPDR
jgi:hypothetical protein